MEQFEERMLLSISTTPLDIEKISLDIETSSSSMGTPSWLSNHPYMSDAVVSAVQRVVDMDFYDVEDLDAISQWVVGMESASGTVLKADSLGAEYLRDAPYLDNLSIWEFPSEDTWQTVVDTLTSAEGVDFFYPLVPRDIERLMVPDDTLFADQWHLLNTGQNGGMPGADSNVVPAWDFVLGTDVVLGIVDDSIQYDHPDLAAQYRADLSWDYGQGDNDPYPVWIDDNHGTAVAGVAGAVGNNGLGVSGSAPGVGLAGIRLDFSMGFTDATEADALTHENQTIDLYNNSWGSVFYYYPMGPLTTAALEDAVTNGRGGLGNVYVFAAGNSRMSDGDANFAAEQNSRYTIAVAALDHYGQYSYYSNPGAALLVSAYSNSVYSGITTTDRTGEDGYNSTGAGDGDPLADIDYTSQFGGTSSASPLVSGIVALILEANPNLTYRDVQSILVNTAKITDPANADWTTNAAGHDINHNYGFGAVDAGAAVNAALTWQNLSEEVSTESGLIPVGVEIPDMGTVGMVSSATLDDSVTDIEWIEVTVDIEHEFSGDLQVILTSPDGTESVLASGSDQWWMFRPDGLRNWTFTSARHWGESSEGEWTLQVRDVDPIGVGTWNSWSIKAYGEHRTGGPGPGPTPVEVGPELISIKPNNGKAISDGDLLHVGPRELKFTFNEGQTIDEATLGAIKLLRAGGDDVLDNANDVVVDYGWIGLGERPNEIVVRFAETLPDDLYRITIVGAGDEPLANIKGTPFHQGEDVGITFDLDLGALVTAIVPQPTWRDAAGDLHQDRHKIVIYFNDDTLDAASAQNSDFYRLTVTAQTADTADDVEIAPQSIVYDAVANTVELTFADDLANLGTGALQLRIGNEWRQIGTTARDESVVGDTFQAATDLGMLGSGTDAASLIVSSEIEPLPFDLEWPGAITDIGHRDLPLAQPFSTHYTERYFAKDDQYGIATIEYNFQDHYGDDPSGNPLHNLISEAQKDRAREIFDLYSYYLGVAFVETVDSGLTIATGDMRALDPGVPTGPGGTISLTDIVLDITIMDAAEDWNDSLYGGEETNWFATAMQGIGHLLGFGYADDMDPVTVLGNNDNGFYNGDPQYYGVSNELVYPGDHDIVHGRHMFRPDGTDVDVYKFEIEQAGTFSAETIAERLQDPSLLDSNLKLYDDANNVIAGNDDYYSEDSYIEVYLQPGTYYVAVSSTGNNHYDPRVEGSGIGGTTQGRYDLRVGFTPDVGRHISDTTGTWLDGDADGVPGGVHNFWFNVQPLSRTIFVDKIADGGTADGTLANPYSQIDLALAAADADDIVRIVGNYDPTFVDQVEYETGTLSHGLATGDLNGDGWEDIVTTIQNELQETNYVSILFGVGDGTFWAPVDYEVGPDPTAVEVGDVTGDGLLDIIVANGGENTLSVLENLGDGAFAALPKLFVGYAPSDLALGDLNGDGALDIVAANATDNTVSILLSNGTGGFLDQDVYDVGAAPAAVALGDFDDNQRIDVVVANSEDDTINVLLNEENIRTKATQFALQAAIAVGDAPAALAAADLTGNGTVDVVVVNTGDNNISVLSGMGGGTFAAPLNYSVGGAPSDVKIAALDNNATLDVVVTNAADDTVSVLFTRPDESLQPPVEYGVGDAPGYLVLSDMDNNGVVDIVTTNSDGDTVSVLVDRRDSAYEIGFDILGRPLQDGWRMEVPQGVTVMVDAGAVFKLRKANIDVGSSTQGIDRSQGALQVLGTPDLSVFFTSFHNKLKGQDNAQFDVPAAGGDWGGLVMRNKLDYEHNDNPGDEALRTILEEEGIFLNYVNHADITYGGGQVVVNSASDVYNPLHMEESRPTLTYNTITQNADAAMSADPNSFADTKFQGRSFTADYDRVGPEIHGNYIVDNSINGIFVRVKTDAGNAMDELQVSARWDDLDIVHVVLENLVINGTPGGPLQDLQGDMTARQDGRLTIDAGILVKLDATRIEVEMGAQLIAEGNADYAIVFTSLTDDRYGMGGTFDTSNNSDEVTPAPGDWGGVYFAPVSSGSIDNALFAYAGGATPIEGRFADFNTVEIHQAVVRITDSVFEYNTSSASGNDFRNGRNTATDALIFVRGAQPIIAGNTMWNNDAPIISLDANSLKAEQLSDWGRSRGRGEAYDDYQNNYGPLVRENHLFNNELNGLLVRGATLTTSSVWDDTDIVHVLRDEIVIPNHHTYSGLRLQSQAHESLVVKLQGSSAGFTALGTPQEIDDRVGGTLQILGAAGFPVVLTSLGDDTFGAGYDPWGKLQSDTDNDTREPTAGDWRSVKLERYVNDRNVAVVNEAEKPAGIVDDANALPVTSQELGSLAWNESSGDDNLRLGFDVRGFIRSDDSADVDVYSFKAQAGVEVWLDIDRTTLGLDTVIELVDANGNVFARSDNSEAERQGQEELYGLARSMDRDVWYINDQYTTNPHDAGMRIVLPGPAGQTRTFFVRVSSKDGHSSGGYQLQVRLREAQEFSGSYINMSSIHYATNGIEMLGLPTHSPLLGTTSEVDREGVDTMASANIRPGGEKNDFSVTATVAGVAFNGATVEFVDGRVTGDNATATYDAATMTLTVDISPTETTGATIVAAVNAEGTFTAALIAEGADANDGNGKVDDLGTMGTLAGGTTGSNNSFAGAEYIGNLLYSDQNALQVSGNMDSGADIDWYSFDVDLQDVQQGGGIQWPTVFDIDYADGMSRPDLAIWVYDASGTLIYASDDANLPDDLAGPDAGADTDDLDRGSLGPFDPYLGTVLLPEGDNMRYFVAVTTMARVPTALDQSLIRLEPATSLVRAGEDHIEMFGGSGIVNSDIPLFDPLDLDINVKKYSLNDVVMFVSTGSDLYTFDPFTGEFETDVTGPLGGQLMPGSAGGISYGDIAMRSDGQLYTFVSGDPAAGDKDPLMRYRQISTENDNGGAPLSDQITGINTFVLDADNNVEATDPGHVSFQALVHGWENGGYVVYAVGNSGGGGDYVSNLLYKFNADGTAIQRPGVDIEDRVPSDIIPLASLTTGPSLLASAATSRTALENDILDGMTFTITTPETEEPDPDPDAEEGAMVPVPGVSLTFEFDLGLDVRLDENGAAAVRDGDIFELNNETFEFNSGEVLVVDSVGNIIDGTTFTITNSEDNLVIFEIDNDGIDVGANHVPVYIEDLADTAIVVEKIIEAINGAEYNNVPFGVTAGSTEAYPQRISLVGENSITTLSSAGLLIEGDADTVSGNVVIEFEENMTPKGETEEVFLASIVDAMNTAIDGVGANGFARPDDFEGDSGRITVAGATNSNFAGTGALTQEGNSMPGVSGGNEPIEITAISTSTEVADAIGAAITAATFGVDLEPQAEVTGSLVKISEIGDPSLIDVSNAGPIENAGAEGTGGNITGLAFMNGMLFAVDDLGGLYEVMDYSSYDLDPFEPEEGPLQVISNESGAALRFITKIEDAHFSGLALGPQNVEAGAYSQTLFATTTDGMIYALNDLGELQPVFINGQTNIQLGGLAAPLAASTGVAFSTLDYNLWHVTDNREGSLAQENDNVPNDGHGIDESPDLTRIPSAFPTTGDLSYWFGLESAGNNVFWTGTNSTVGISGAGGQDAGTYNLPGGAHGTLTTDEFSLAGSEALDQPMLYFNYFLETDGNVNQITDSARVYISHDGADWTMLASNILTTRSAFPEWNKYDDLQDYDVFNLKDGTGEWLQAQVDLSRYVDGLTRSYGSNVGLLNETLSGLRVKFEFSTAGSMNIGEKDGDKLLEGGYLRVAAGDEIIDGHQFVMVDLITETETTFEFDMGFSLVAANSAGQQIADGDTLTIDGYVFEMVKDREYDGLNYPIYISDGDSASDVVNMIAKQLMAAFEDEVFLFDSMVEPYVKGDRIYLGGALTVETTTAGLEVQGSEPGLLSDQIVSTDPTDFIPVTITPFMTSTEVAEQMALTIDATLVITDVAEYYQTVKVDRDLLQTAGYTVIPIDDCPLTYSDMLQGDNPAGSYTQSQYTQFNWHRRGEDNLYEGFYVDDVIVGFAERGQMVTDARPDTGFRPVPNPVWDTVDPGWSITYAKGPSIVEGPYQLEIRTGTDYAAQSPFRSFDTNDRLTQSLVIEAEAAVDLVHGVTFTVNDGVNAQTFQFVDSLLGNADEGNLPVYFMGTESASQMALVIVNAINNASLLLSKADATLGGNRVYLTDAASVAGISVVTYDQGGQNASAIEAADLNDDGIVDIITANEYDGTVSVMIGYLNPVLYLGIILEVTAWMPPTFFDVGGMPSDLELGDVNGDSFLDIVTTNAQDGTVSVLLGNGDGTFEEQLIFAVGTSPAAVTLADVDGNRLLDILTANKADDTVSVLYGIGDGTFMPHDDLAVGRSPMDVAVADIDGNGMADIVAANSRDNTISVLYEVGLTAFAPQVTIAVGGIPVSLAVGDIDAANGPDILVANRGEGTVTVLLNDGLGAFMPDPTVIDVGQGPVAIRLEDANLDDALDIAVANLAADTVTVAYGNGAGGFGPAMSVEIGGGSPTSLAFANTGMAALDLIAASSETQKFYVHSSTGGPYEPRMPSSDPEFDLYEYNYGMPNLRYLNGDNNEERDQGQIIIRGNEITDVTGWGIVYDSGTRDGGDANLPHLGSVLPLVEVNEQRLLPGVTIENNLVAAFLGGGILFSGDANNGDVPIAAVPFGRILNNTIYGGALGVEDPIARGIGIQVEENASPTILNNIISTTTVAIGVDTTSQTTIIAANSYQHNTTNVSGMGPGQHDMVLGDDAPLFVDPSAGNFYPAAGSQVIDSSLDSLQDRPALIAVRDPLGIPESPILAPERDLLGQARADDLTVSPPPGLGRNVFKDRGAIDRLDFIGPTASVINPMDNEAGLDSNPADNDVFVIYGDFTEFTIQLSDVAGVGIADATVLSANLSMYVDGDINPLIEGRDYFFSYDVNTDQISLVPATGIWEHAHNYEIILDNSSQGIRDIADNPLRGNRLDKTTRFKIAVGHIDYGDAPDPTYRTLLDSDGARHLLIGDYYLGQGVTSESDAQFALDEDGVPLWNAGGDLMDDGVVFGSALVIDGFVSVTITASRNGGYLDAWIDFNNDGDWDDVGEQIFAAQLLGKGENELQILIPTSVVDDDGLNDVVDQTVTFARFRYSSDDSGLAPFGEASDGEVEDYEVHIVGALLDFGDAPRQYPTLLADDGAYHALSIGGLHLGQAVDDELDGQPNASATGDDNDDELLDDEDGVVTNNWFIPGQTTSITVTASEAGYLNAWIDFNRDGDWDDAGEQIAVGALLAAGENTVAAPVPGDAEEGVTYARFRFSSEAVLAPTGPAADGEVEDYRFLISTTPYDFGDAPLSYPTMKDSGAATLLVQQIGSNNDFLLTATTVGTIFNEIEVVIVNESASGDEALVVFSVVESRLTIDVDPTATTANIVLDEINTEGTFIATLHSVTDIDNDGSGFVGTLGNFGETDGGFDGVGLAAAHHLLGQGLYLGSVVDAETNGQAGPMALGDDENDEDDEDGVVFGDLVTSQEGTITVTATYEASFSGTGYLNAWIDFDQDGVWTADEIVVAGAELIAGENELAVTIPGDAVEGMTFARFRFSTQIDLTFEGLAADGEVEDHQVEIQRGNTSINGYKFDDRDNDAQWDAGEPGIVGVTIYVDLNNDNTLNLDSFGNPTEPFTVTRKDDLATLDEDETGFYEFRGLMAQQDPYTVREIKEDGWDQTYPNASVNLPDGSFGNDDGSYTVYLAEAEEVADVNFGNFRRPVVFVSDVKVVEGDVGYTELEVTVHLQESFGDTIAVHYWTEDGTAIAALPDLDYQAADGVVTFPSRPAPETPWEQEILTKGFTQEARFHISGDYVVWQGRDRDSDDWEIFIFDGTYDANDDPNIIQLTDNDSDDTAPFVVQTEDGVHAVWSHLDALADGGDTEIWFYDGTQAPGGQPNVAALTDNTFDDRDPQASDSIVAWWAAEGMGMDSEIFLYDIEDAEADPGYEPINLSDNEEDDYNPQVSGEMVVWTGLRGYHEIILYDGTDFAGRPRVEQLTSNNYMTDSEPRIDDNTIVWQRQFGGDNYEIYIYEVDPGGAIGLPTRLTNNSVPDRYPQISGDNIVWQAKDESWDNDLEIMHYNMIAQTDPVNITNNSTFDQRPQISGTQVVWQGFDVANWEVFTYELYGEDGVQNVSQNTDTDWYPEVSGSMIVWRTSGDEDALIIARAGKPEITKTVHLRVIGDMDLEPDENFFLKIEAASSDSNLSVTDDTAEIAILNDDGALDYGDAADPFYPTLVASDGARHLIVVENSIYLGDASAITIGNPDAEDDGLPSEYADGDNLLTGNDEKGVVFDTDILPGGTVQVTVEASTDSILNAWIDLNRDGDWDDTWADGQEHMFVNEPLLAGENILTFEVPANASLGHTYARFRVSSHADIGYRGYVDDGEVEDYRQDIGLPQTPATSQSFALLGSDEDDTFEFIAGEVLQVIVNGVLHEFSAATVGEIMLQAGLGYDTVILRGSEDDETFELWSHRGTFQTGGYSVQLTGAESIIAISGGGDDVLTMHDTEDDDRFELRPQLALLSGLGFNLRAQSFAKVVAMADGGGDDEVDIYDSSGDDTLTTTFTSALMTGEGFELEAVGFETVRGHATSGGEDRAVMYDSAGSDTAVLSPTYAKLYNGSVYTEANGFERVRMVADAGGYDKATLLGSAADDVLKTGPTYAKMIGDDFYYRVEWFDRVTARSEGGNDVAQMWDSTGDDTFVSSPTLATMRGDGFYIKAENFADVTGYGNAGGFDSATLEGSTGIDSFVATTAYGKLSGAGFSSRAYGFEKVEAVGQGGQDTAVLYDSVYGDDLVADDDWVSLGNQDIDFEFLVRSFAAVEANSSSQGDKKDIAQDVDFLFAKGLWEDI